MNKNTQKHFLSFSFIYIAVGLTRFVMALTEFHEVLTNEPIIDKIVLASHKFFFPPRDLALAYIVLICSTAFLFLLKKRIFFVLHHLILLFASITIITWIYSSPWALRYGFSLRYALSLISIPFYLSFLYIFFRRNKLNNRREQNYAFIGIFAASIFCIVMLIEGVQFNSHLEYVRQKVYNSDKNCIEIHDLFKDDPSFLEHWGLTTLLLITEGKRRPEKVVVEDRMEFYTIYSEGKHFFDFSSIIDRYKYVPDREKSE